jgi:hypothetical protein
MALTVIEMGASGSGRFSVTESTTTLIIAPPVKWYNKSELSAHFQWWSLVD